MELKDHKNKNSLYDCFVIKQELNKYLYKDLINTVMSYLEPDKMILYFHEMFLLKMRRNIINKYLKLDLTIERNYEIVSGNKPIGYSHILLSKYKRNFVYELNN